MSQFTGDIAKTGTACRGAGTSLSAVARLRHLVTAGRETYRGPARNWAYGIDL